MKRALILLSAAVALGLPLRLAAHEGHAHKVMGTVTFFDGTRIEVDTKDAKKESFELGKDTKYLKGKTPAVAADVKVGTRVVLSVVEKDGKKAVSEVVMAEKTAGESKDHKH